MKSALRIGVRGLRALAGHNTALEGFLEHQYANVKGKIDKKYVGDNFTLFWTGPHGRNRTGIYMKGSCDLASIFASTPLIHRVLQGTCCIFREGLVSDARSDLLMQTLRDLPQAHLRPVIEKLQLPDYYFQPRFADKTFLVPGWDHLGEFPKTVIVLSIAADVTRTLYRHKEHGFLVDPGGWWLNQSIDKVLPDLSIASWFREHFESIGRIPLDAFVENFTKIIQLLNNKIGAHILVFNMLTVEPGNPTHNYQLLKNPHWLRRREFHLALAELSQKLDFAIVDVDRILKNVGIIETQVDFAHFPMQAYQPIAQEVFNIMRSLEVF